MKKVEQIFKKSRIGKQIFCMIMTFVVLFTMLAAQLPEGLLTVKAAEGDMNITMHFDNSVYGWESPAIQFWGGTLTPSNYASGPDEITGWGGAQGYTLVDEENGWDSITQTGSCDGFQFLDMANPNGNTGGKGYSAYMKQYTDATPKDIKDIFENITLPKMDYGAVRLDIKKHRFDIMTFRKEISYYNNRKPMEVEYIKDLESDLRRRDFTMNTLCIDKDGNVIDLLNGKEDIENRVINTVGESISRFVEDPLRILRAVRFYTTLEFDLGEEVRLAIIQTKGELSRLSYQRKKDELDKIFCHTNVKRGIDLIVELGLDKELGLDFR